MAELSGLNRRDGWIKGMRLIVRRVKPSGRQVKDLTAFEKKTGWKYSTPPSCTRGTRWPAAQSSASCTRPVCAG
ncbi:hypothetical protein OG331_47955 [Streptomyces sp. NBC_01017]|uniref:hypothetical protein n=1 Tax=Streptomyces sp. NBC_01017 TaxID=2903721 RepID=UPI00386F2F7A|nr:hypothetical protein OG331_04025 [Streptomyces sp. NBC_01017]WSV36017.1 hypothetical protein OG331_47955 [Streptomyces sp. NBC_01017]